MTDDSRRAMREIEREQRVVSRIYARLDELRARVRHRLAEVRRAGRHGGSAQARTERDTFATHYEDELARLENVETRLVFGRLDLRDDSRLYIGRLGLSSKSHRPLLIDWRAPQARAFYQATALHPGEVVRRRHLTTHDREVIAVDDDLLNAEAASDAMSNSLTGEGALFAALGAAREGRMSDIVATIQAEQDAIIRDDLQGILVVQGGPGTGKTAVALHRAAYLLYAHRERLERSGVLLVGPTGMFLEYIDQVLPSLGETNVVSLTIGTLLPGVVARHHDRADVADVKGSLAMVDVVERAVKGLVRIPESDQVLTIEGVEVTLPASEVLAAAQRAQRSGKPHNEARVDFVLPLLEFLVRGYALARQLDPDDDFALLYEDVRQAREVKRALNLAWMPATAETLLKRLYATRPILRQYSPGLDDRQRQLLFRPADAPFTIEDIPILDELAEALGGLDQVERSRERAQRAREFAQEVDFAARTIEGQHVGGGMVSPEMLAARFTTSTPRSTLAERAAQDRQWSYGHIVVDEAQELSPMAWRALLRRCPSR
ncbi:MAG: AAA family ATPase, partial [Bowdeniella nasicola]|nr:AAA family ATPase [Bowdeniella nasicola]